MGTAGLELTDDGDGAITFTGNGNGSDEAITYNFDDTANTVGVSTSTGVTKWDMNQMAFVGVPKTIMSFTIQNPIATSDSIKIRMKRGTTITRVSAKCESGTSVVGRLYEVDSDGDQSDQAGIDSADWTVTTSLFEDSTLTNNSLDADDWLAWDTTSVNGSVWALNVTVDGYES
jgi:hypothetical protein